MTKIISISGLDGSGKSTQIRLLKNYFETRGKRVYYFHAIDFGIANKIKNIIKKSSNTYRRSTISVTSERSVMKANWLTIWLRKVFLKIDIGRFNNLIKKLEKDGYGFIVSDRYFYDSLINIAYLLGGSTSNWRLSLQIPKPDLAVYLQTDPENIMRRERIPDQGLEYLKKKKELYDSFAEEFNLTIINGNRSKDEIFNELKSWL